MRLDSDTYRVRGDGDRAPHVRFNGDEPWRDKPGTIDFPSREEWDRQFPGWEGKREIVRQRIVDYARPFSHLQFLVRLLAE